MLHSIQSNQCIVGLLLKWLKLSETTVVNEPKANLAYNTVDELASDLHSKVQTHRLPLYILSYNLQHTQVVKNTHLLLRVARLN